MLRFFVCALILAATASLTFAQGDPSFRIARVRFTGNQNVATEELAALARKYEGRTVTVSQLKTLTQQVRDLYHARGYFLARAVLPVQKIKPGGDVQLVVREGRYGRVLVEGNKYYSDEFVKRYFERATRGGVVRQDRLERSLLVLDEMPDLTVRSLFVPGQEPGTADVQLRVQDRRPFHVGLDYNNYGSPLVGRNRAGLSLSGGNVIWEGDELTGRITEPFPAKSDPLFQGGYSVPVGNDGNKLAYSFARTSTRVAGALESLDLRGDAEIHALQWLRPIQRTLARSMNVNAGLVFKTVENFVFGNTRVSQDNLRMLTVGADINTTRGKRRTYASAVITQGLGEALNGNRAGDPRSSRVGASNEFTKFAVELFHTMDLGHERWLLARFSGQVALDPLAVAEQFGLGGPDSVRGYIQSDFLGDDGYSSSLEVRQGFYHSKDGFAHLQAAAFFDHGDASLQRPQVGEVQSRSFSGAGVGLRGSFGRTTTMRLDIGHRLTDRNSLGDSEVLYAQVASRF